MTRNTVIKAHLQARVAHRNLLAKVRMAGRQASRAAMQTMGYTVIVENGKLIKRFPDGRFIVLREIEAVPRPERIVLD